MNLENIKRRIAFILALTIPLSMVGCKNESKVTDEQGNVTVYQKTKLKPEEIALFLKNMSEITPVYNLEEIFLSDEELDTIIKNAENNQECDNKTATSDEIYNAIIENSVEENGHIKITYDLSENEKSELEEFIKDCLKNALEAMASKNEISLEDACVMKDLTIIIGVSENGYDIDYISEDNVLIFDYQSLIEFYNRYDSEQLRKNLIKEGTVEFLKLALNYCRLQTCNCRLEKGQTNRTLDNNLPYLKSATFYSRDTSDLGDVNQFRFDYLDITNKHNNALFLLLAVFKENRNIEDIYQIVFDSNVASLFEYFDLKTKEEIEEFYKIARGLTVASINTEFKEDFYKKTTSVNEYAFSDYIGYGQKANIFKLSIKDLMKYIADNRDLTKEEAMLLYKFVKEIVLNKTGLKGSYDQFDPDFAKTILAVENIYFDFLTKFYGITMDEADELYEDYHSYNGFQDGRQLNNIDYQKLITKFPLLKYIEKNYLSLGYYCDHFEEQTRK